MASARARATDSIGAPHKNKTETKVRADRPGPTARTLTGLPPRSCHYPVGPATGRRQLFCGRPAEKGDYCAACGPRMRIAGSAMSRDEIGYWAAVAEGRR